MRTLLSITHYWRGSPILTLTGILCLVALIPSFAMSLQDPRLFQGINTWIKPMKFQASVGIYLLTLAYFLGHLMERGRTSLLTRGVAWTAAITGAFEVVWITYRGALNEKSHFAYDGGIGSIMYILMGVGALLLTASSLGVAWRWAKYSAWPLGVLRYAVLIGLVITGITGIFTGGTISFNSGHWVGGAETDAGGLPIVGWVRDGGDLRVAHFFALHALQIIPLYAAFVSALGVRGGIGRAFVSIFGIAYVALIYVTWAQARQGIPFMGGLGL